MIWGCVFQVVQIKYLKGEYYIEVKDKRYKNHPTEKIILQKRDPLKFLRKHYQVQNNFEIRKNQKVVKISIDEFLVKIILKINNQLFNKQNLNRQIVHPVNKIIVHNLIKDGIVRIVNTLLINKNIKLNKMF